MQRTQTARTVMGEAGLPKNCSEWAMYERVNSTSTAAMCHGGFYDGDWFEPCESKDPCRQATLNRLGGTTADQRRHLPVVESSNPMRPFVGSSNPGSSVVGGTPNLAGQVRDSVRESMREWAPWKPSVPVNIPTAKPGSRPQTQLSPTQVGIPMPFPVQAPPDWPEAMQTPYAGPTPLAGGGITPTFLPTANESIMNRLVRNIVQGWIGSTGWHTYDYARSVDLFPHKK